MRLVVVAALALAAAVVLTAPRPADACSCAGDPAVAPADGAVEVPRNVVIVVRDSLGEVTQYDLSSDTETFGVEAVRVAQQFGYTIDLVSPVTPLPAQTTATLTATGEVTLTLTTFTTAAESDVTAPEPPSFDVALAHAGTDQGSSCGTDYYSVDLALDVASDVIALEVTLATGGDVTELVVPIDAIGELSTWSSDCGPVLRVIGGEEHCLELRARDASGNLSAPVQQCVTATACANLEDAEDFRPDLTDCEPYAPPDTGGCRTSSPTGLALPLAALLLLLYAMRRRARLVALGAIVTAAVVATAPRPAHACSCWVPKVVAPADGASDVPTNAVIVISNRSPDPSEPILLTGPDGPVPFEVTLVFSGIAPLELVRPLEPLAATSDYTLTLPPDDYAFRTGEVADLTPPAPAELGPLAIAHARSAVESSSCGSVHLDIDFSIALPADAVAAELTIQDGDLEIRHVITAEQITRPLGGSSDDCSRNFPLERGHEVCFVVRSRDQAGNLAAPVEECAQVKACADLEPGDSTSDLSDCELATSSSAGCRATSPTAPAPLLLLALAYAVLLSARYARKCRIAARADSRSPARS